MTVMTSSRNMNLFLEFSIVEYTKKPVRCLELFMQYYLCTYECFYAGVLTLGARVTVVVVCVSVCPGRYSHNYKTIPMDSASCWLQN